MAFGMLRRIPPVYSRLSPGAFKRAVLANMTAGELHANPLASLYPQRSILLTDSGTSALTLAMSLTRRADCATVALPAYGCPDLGTAAVAAGCDVALYDVDPATLTPDRESLAEVLRRGVSAVVVTHLFGMLADVPAIRAMVEPYGAVVIEDAAQHAGGTLDGVRGGSFGTYSVLSFGRGKGLNAAGGGALIRAGEVDDQWQTLVRASDTITSWKVLVRALAVQLLSQPWLFWAPTMIPQLALGETVYHAPRPVAAITKSSRALLAWALSEEGAELAIRRANDAWFRRALQAAPEVQLPVPGAQVHSGALRLPALLDAAVGARLARFGVARSYPRLLSEYPPVAERMPWRDVECGGALRLARQLFTLPTHALVSTTEREGIVRALRR